MSRYVSFCAFCVTYTKYYVKVCELLRIEIFGKLLYNNVVKHERTFV